MFACIYSQQIPAEVSLAEFAYAFSPLVEETATNTVVIDVEGCALRFGSTYELVNEIASQAKAAKKSGGLACKVNVALAANPDAAIHAAKFCRGVTFTAPGEELTCLGRLPLTALQSSLAGVEESQAADILETLNLWGVRNFEEFAALPVAGVSERLGQDGLKLQKLAGGKTNRHLKLKQPEPVFQNSCELEYPISQLEALSFILARLLNQTCASLNAYALATNALQVELKLENGVLHGLKLNLPYPMRDHKVFLKLLLLETEMHPPPAAVVGVSINCEPVKPRLLQTGLFIPLAPEPEKLELMLARLAKLVGAENIGAPELLDSHRPDAFRVNRFALPEAKRKRGGSSSRQQTANSKQQTANSRQQSVGSDQQSMDSAAKFEIRNPQCEIRNSKCEIPKFTLAFRRYRPPLRALVQAQQGQPLEISAWDKNKSVYGKVVCAAGPWRTTGEWWRADTWARDEWDVAVECGAKGSGTDGSRLQVLYRIYRELQSGTWFVEGMYD